jgi:hypothetical protein
MARIVTAEPRTAEGTDVSVMVECDLAKDYTFAIVELEVRI